jgi:hypothetical protein
MKILQDGYLKCMFHIQQKVSSSYHKLYDVKSKLIKNKIRIKSEMETTTNSPISCLR